MLIFFQNVRNTKKMYYAVKLSYTGKRSKGPAITGQNRIMVR